MSVHGPWDHIERRFVMCSGYTWQDPTRRDMRRGRYLNCTRGFVYLSLNAVELLLSQKLFLFEPDFKWILAVSCHVCIWREGFNFDAWTEVERLLRKMLLKLASTMFPITLNPSMQFLVCILLSWLAGMHQEAFKRHVSIACLLWPLSNLGRSWTQPWFQSFICASGLRAFPLCSWPPHGYMQETHLMWKSLSKIIDRVSYSWHTRCFFVVTLT